MCRNSTKSIGFLLLLWIGVFVPVAEYQASSFAGSASLNGLLDVTVGGDGEQADTADTSAQADGSISHASSSAGTDLSDFVLAAAHPHVAALRNPLTAHRVAEGFASRDLPPQERPPNASAA